MRTNNFILKLLCIFESKDRVEITFPELADFNEKKKISNTLAQSVPLAIVYCENAAHIQKCLGFSRSYNLDFRIRSGGHNHEGYCSGNNVLVIDISKINGLTTYTNRQLNLSLPAIQQKWKDINGFAKIGAGIKFGSLYSQLIAQNYIVAGGGCESVSLGGFAQGGGWGPYSRFLGLGCDNVLGIEIALPDGTVTYAFDEALIPLEKELIKLLDISPGTSLFSDKKSKLLYAIRGGGGGNFGVIVTYFYRIHLVTEDITEFIIQYPIQKANQLVEKWIRLTKESPAELTTACRIAVSDPKDSNSYGAVVSGKYLGDESKLKTLLKNYGLIVKDSDVKCVVTHINRSLLRNNMLSDDMADTFSLPKQLNFFDFNELSDRLSNLILSKDATLINEDYPNAPKSTCDQPHPHKVSSCFPKDPKNHAAFTNELIKIASATTYDKRISQYFSLHGLGGNINNTKINSVMPYKDKDFLLQLQSWWDFNSSNNFNKKNIEWIKQSREKIKKYAEGAFINFIDKDLVADYNPENKQQREELLRYYYNDKLEALKKIKREIDPENRFNFEMSIPLP